MKKDYIYISAIVILVLFLLVLLCLKNNNTKYVTNEVAISEAVVYLKPGTDYNLTLKNNSKGNYVFESSNPNIATVDRQTGRVEAHSTGSVIISAVDASTNTVYDSCEIVVQGPTTTTTSNTKKSVETTKTTEQSVRVTFAKNDIVMDAGTTESITSFISPSNATNQTLTWSSDNENVATVSNGVVTAKSGGTAIITATTSTGNTETCKVTVIEKTINVSSIKINTDKKAVYTGSTLGLSITVNPGDATNKTITWSSSDNSIATVSDGIVTGIKPGTVTITAKSNNGKESTIKISVLDSGNEISSIRINTSGTSLKIGDSLTLIATISPSYAQDKSVTWSSSDSSVVSVTSNGVITAKKLGTAIITATSSNGKTSTSRINVVNNGVEVTNIRLSKTSAEAKVGDKISIDATITPTNATRQKLTWTSSNESIATVSYGTVTALKPGTVTITARSENGISASCTITISEKPVTVTKITLSKTFTTLYVGQTEKITVNLSPSNVSDKTVTWYSENQQIVTVTSDGVLKGVSVGTTEVSAKSSNGKVATIKVRVESGVTSISLNKTSISLNIGKTEKLVATVLPSNAQDKSVTWSSSDNSIATVSNGTVTAIKPGTVTITAKTSNGKVATCKVVVNNPYIAVTDIKLNITNSTIKVGETISLVATITPANATNKSVTWSSSDNSIATVSNNGVVTGIKAGTATITAKSSSGKIATSKITVKANSYYKLDKTNISCEVGESVVITTTASSKTSTYSINNSKIANVNYNSSNKYTIKCLSAGYTLIKFVGLDGASALLGVTVTKKTNTYNIATDSKYYKYEQIASCYSNTMSYRIIKISGNYYTLIWVANANKQVNNGLANYNAQGILPAEEIFSSKSVANKCFIGINGSFTTNESPRTDVVISEGRIAKNKGYTTQVIGIDSNGYLRLYNNYSASTLINLGVRNTFRVSGTVSSDKSTDQALRTQIYQYDKNNFVIYSGSGTVSSGFDNVKALTGITEGYNLEGGAGRKLYYRTKSSALTKVVGGDKKIPDALYITE